MRFEILATVNRPVHIAVLLDAMRGANISRARKEPDQYGASSPSIIGKWRTFRVIRGRP